MKAKNIFLLVSIIAAMFLGGASPLEMATPASAQMDKSRLVLEDEPPLPPAPVAMGVAVAPETAHGKVTASMLNVRNAPNGTVMATLVNSTEVTIFGEQDGWYRIGEDEWVSAKWILLDENKVQEAVVREQPLVAESCVHDEACWVDVETYYTPAPQHIVGNAVMYAKGIMEASAVANGFDLEGFKGGVAMASAGNVGDVVWLRNQDIGQWEGPYLVVDVSSRGGVWTHVVTRHQSVEVDFNTAVEWGMASPDGTIIHGGYHNIEVWTGLLPPDEDTTLDDATNYRDYFLTIARFGTADGGRLWSLAYADYVDYGDYLAALETP